MARYQKKPPTLGHIADVRPTARALANWREAWELGTEMTYVGWADPLPMPPSLPCKPCGGGMVYWTEAVLPHNGWRCRVCHPPPPLTKIRLWSPPEIAPEPDPPTTQTEDEWI